MIVYLHWACSWRVINGTVQSPDLGVDFLRLLVVQQAHHLSRGVEAHEDLETGVTGTRPALGSTAVRTVHVAHDGGVHDGAAVLVRPHAVAKEQSFPINTLG